MIPRHEFFSQYISHQEVLLRIIYLLSKSSIALGERLFYLAYNSVRKRTASALLSLQQVSNGNGTNGIASKVIISRDDLAALVGITPESVSRTLHDFKDEKLITFKSKSSEIHILNKNELTSMRN